MTIPNLFPTPAVWTANFLTTNGQNVGGYSGLGAIETSSMGTWWNPIVNVSSGGYYTNASSSNDVETINTGVSVAIQGTGSGNDGSGHFMFNVYEGLSGVYQPNGIVITTEPGFYNLFIYSMIGAYDNRGCNFTVHGIVEGATNVPGTQGGGNYGPANPANGGNYSYVQNSNYVIFTNVLITNGVLDVGVNTNQGGSTDDLNGMQLQLIAPYTPPSALAFATLSGVTSLSWSGTSVALESATNVNGPWLSVTNLDGSLVTSPYTIPAQPPKSAIFYIAPLPTTIIDPAVPTLPDIERGNGRRRKAGSPRRGSPGGNRCGMLPTFRSTRPGFSLRCVRRQ